jgi:hypothetical protein
VISTAARTQSIRVAAPTSAAAVSLVQEAVGLFRAELVEDEGCWEVHFHPDGDSRRFQGEVTSFVSRWLGLARVGSTTAWIDGYPHRISPRRNGRVGA